MKRISLEEFMETTKEEGVIVTIKDDEIFVYTNNVQEVIDLIGSNQHEDSKCMEK